MSLNYPEQTLQSAHKVIHNGIAEIQHLTTGDIPASWGMAAAFARDIAEACRVAELELADHFAATVTGNDAMRAVCDEPMWSEESFAADIAQTIAARKATIPTATPEEEVAFTAFEAEQARQDALKPEVFDIVNFAGDILGIEKGA